MLTDTQRAALVAEAKSWVGTPYRGWANIKGVGADCGQFLYGVYRALSLIPAMELPKDYSLQAAQHQASGEYMAVIDRFFRVIPESEVKPADLVCYQIGQDMAHAAFIVSWPGFVIQAELRHGVSGSHGLRNPNLRERRYLSGATVAFRTLRDGGQ